VLYWQIGIPEGSDMASGSGKVMVQRIEYLGLWPASVTASPAGEKVVIVTVRPDEGSFRPHNLALSEAQAKRLAEDLVSALGRVVSILLIATVATATSGCSTRVEVESAKAAPAATERSRTAAEIDLLQSRSPEPVATPKSSEPPPGKPTAQAESPVTISLVFNFRGGDVIRHETVVNVHEVPASKAEERVTLPRSTEIVPRRPVDPQCERLRKEHEERIRRWRATPPRQ
jgi:hypothetical protein